MKENTVPDSTSARLTQARSRRLSTSVGVALGTVACASMLAAAPAMAARPSDDGKGSGRTTTSSSLTLVPLESTDGQVHQGQDVTFEVSTTGTTEPYVSLACYQGGKLVYSAVTGYFDGYPWPGTNVFTLSSGAWTAGAADCSAQLYWYDGRKTVTGAILQFPVMA